MSRITILSVLFASISTVVGCGAHGHATQPAAAPTASTETTAAAADGTTECAPPPGGDMQFDFDGASKPAATRSNTAATSFKSNAVEKPKSGAVHAAY